MNPKGIRRALATTLRVNGLRVSAVSVDSVTPPQAIVHGPDPITYSETFDAGHHLTFRVQLLVPRTSEQSAQDALDDYLSDAAGSIYALLEADKTLGGAVMSAQVTTAQNLGAVTDGQLTYASVDFIVDVMT